MKTVYVVIVAQERPMLSETIQSIHDSLEGAEYEMQNLEISLPLDFKISIEPFEVQSDGEYNEAD